MKLSRLYFIDGKISNTQLVYQIWFSIFFLFYEINFIQILLETVTLFMLLVAHHLFFLTLHLLLWQLLLGLVISYFGHNFFLFGENNFDVAWRWHVWINTTVSTVCTTTQTWSSVNLQCTRQTEIRNKIY